MARRARSRVLIALGTSAALAGAFAAGLTVADDDPGARPGDGASQVLAAAPGPVPAAHGARVTFADTCADLLESYVDRATPLVGPWGWGPGQVYRGVWFDSGMDGMVVPVAEQLSNVRGPATAGRARLAKAPVSQRATSDDSGTNVQETGVDEPDVVKTDGELLVRIDGGVLTTYDVSGGAEPTELGRLVLDRARHGELLLSGTTVTVIAAQDDGATRVLTVDVTDPAAPALTATAEYDAALLEARLHGTTVRIVATAALPDLRFVSPGPKRTEQEATRANRALVAGTTIEDWLPTVTDDAGTRPLLDCDAVAVPEEPSGLGTVAVVGWDAADPTERTARGVAAAADIAYFSADHLYLAAAHGEGWWGPCCGMIGRITQPAPYDDDLAGTTTLHDLALDGTATTYLASGHVDGVVADRWAMDEDAGVLRLAVGPTRLTGDFNSVVTLEQDGARLVEAGRVDKLGVNEQIESVRWFDGLAIVVTFRQTDPLYAIDLTDPAAPTLMGELKIPGFSEYLHPLGPMRMIGLGQGPTGRRGGWGAQAGLFDVTDLTAPTRLDVLPYGARTEALAGLDPRQVTWLPEVRTFLTVVARGWTGRTGFISVITLHRGQMTNRMVEVEHGQDVDEVRTVPLGDGRVVLVTGTEVSYFDL